MNHQDIAEQQRREAEEAERAAASVMSDESRKNPDEHAMPTNHSPTSSHYNVPSNSSSSRHNNAASQDGSADATSNTNFATIVSVSEKSHPRKRPAPSTASGSTSLTSNSADTFPLALNRIRPKQRKTERRVQKLEALVKTLRQEREERAEVEKHHTYVQLEVERSEKERIQRLLSFLNFHASYERDQSNFEHLVEDSFWFKQPITPFRYFRNSEVQQENRTSYGAAAIVADAASLKVMSECIGVGGRSWAQVKRDIFSRQEKRCRSAAKPVPQKVIDADPKTQPSVSSISSNSASSGSDEDKAKPKRKNSIARSPQANSAPNYNKVDKMNLGKLPSQKKETTIPNVVAANKQQQTKAAHATHSTTCPTLTYTINEDEVMQMKGVIQAKFSFSTINAKSFGASCECSCEGMLRAKFSHQNKLESLELVYDGMSFMEKLAVANGRPGVFETVHSRLDVALSCSTSEPKVITTAQSPFSIVAVNAAWTSLTQHSQFEAEGNGYLHLLGVSENGESSMQGAGQRCLEEVAMTGRCASFMEKHYNKSGTAFICLVCCYPLTNVTNDVTHISHVVYDLTDRS